jgi:FtsP/CotA-like multicopper oxidase with cupredoxin domain
VQADGQNIEPVSVDEFRIAVAETYDVIVEPRGDEAYCIFAQAIDRSGYARGTLTSSAELHVPVPPMDPRPLLTMAAMGMEDTHAHSMSMPGMNMQVTQNSNIPVQERSIETGPSVDNVAKMPVERLDDPGVGLRDNGRRVLTYADLKALTPFHEQRDPDRELVLHLTGNMQRFIWGFDGTKYSDADPIRTACGASSRTVTANTGRASTPSMSSPGPT